MWGISYANLAMMLADSVALIISKLETGAWENRIGGGVPGTAQKMNFREFMKEMHRIHDRMQQP